MTYLAHLRKQPCTVCGRLPSEAAHTKQGDKRHGMGIKARDGLAIPLCAYCHRDGPLSYHALGDEERWCEAHEVDLEAVRRRMRERWAMRM